MLQFNLNASCFVANMKNFAQKVQCFLPWTWCQHSTCTGHPPQVYCTHDKS